MAKSEVANSRSRDQIPREIESSYEKLKIVEEPCSDSGDIQKILIHCCHF